MASISGTDRAILTARAGVARAGAFRAGFIPADTRGASPGTAGGFYIWQSYAMPADTTWAEVKPE